MKILGLSYNPNPIFISFTTTKFLHLLSMKKVLLFILLSFYILTLSWVSIAQTYDTFYGATVEQSSYDTLLSNLNKFVDFGVKEIGTSAQANTKKWIINSYSEHGYTNIEEDIYTYNGQSASNVIITKTGMVHPDTYLIICSHYDTRNGPGANDNGTGTVIVMEIARLLKDIETEYSIKFIHFSTEEDGLIGSQNYVNSVVVPQNLDISLVFNIDGVGGVSGMTNNTIICERDEDAPNSNNNESAIITDELATCVELYSNLYSEISYAYASDYMPFEDNGEIITGLYEKNETTVGHTPNDIIENLDFDYTYQVAKVAIGASMHFSLAYESTIDICKSQANNTISAYPNPTEGKLFINLNKESELIYLELVSINGQVLQSISFNNSSLVNIDMNVPAGIYFLRILSNETQSVIKVVKE